MPKGSKHRPMPESVKAMLRARRGGGGGGGGGGGRNLRSSHRGAARPGGFFGKTVGTELRPVQALLFGVAGYLSGRALQATGLPRMLYGASKWYHNVTDRVWNATNGATNLAEGSGLMKVVGGIGMGKSLYDSRNGKISSGNLNTRMPFFIGAILDPPAGGGGGDGGSMSRWG